MGNMIWAKCIGIDDKGRVKLSRKAALKERAELETASASRGNRAARLGISPTPRAGEMASRRESGERAQPHR
jgi:predicted RNA-binding protein with RPS1 domain